MQSASFSLSVRKHTKPHHHTKRVHYYLSPPVIDDFQYEIKNLFLTPISKLITSLREPSFFSHRLKPPPFCPLLQAELRLYTVLTRLSMASLEFPVLRQGFLSSRSLCPRDPLRPGFEDGCLYSIQTHKRSEAKGAAAPALTCREFRFLDPDFPAQTFFLVGVPVAPIIFFRCSSSTLSSPLFDCSRELMSLVSAAPDAPGSAVRQTSTDVHSLSHPFCRVPH